MGNYEQGVGLALKNNMLQDAKEQANKAEDESVRKGLWMVIAVWLMERSEENMMEVVQLTRETDSLKIEDLLPYFTETIKLEHFKTELCTSLKNYNDEIEKLKMEMGMFYQNQDQLKRDLKAAFNKSLILSKKQKCDECFKLLYAEEFVAFTCMHCFHKECLWLHIKDNARDYAPEYVNKLHELYIQFSQAKSMDMH